MYGRPAQSLPLSAGGQLWHVFSTTQLTVPLLLILSGLFLTSVLVKSLLSASPPVIESHPWWPAGKVPGFGGLVSFVRFLSLDNILHSPLFLAIGLILITNIIVFRIVRWRQLRTSVTLRYLRWGMDFYLAGKSHYELHGLRIMPEVSANLLLHTFHRHGYRVQAETQAERIFFSGSKNRFTSYISYAGHLSILLAAIGLLISSCINIGGSPPVLLPVDTIENSQDTPLLSSPAISASSSFLSGKSVVDYPTGATISPLAAASGSSPIPYILDYQGKRLHLFSVARAVGISIESEGETLFAGTVPLTERQIDGGLQRSCGSVDVLPGNLTATVVAPIHGKPDASLASDEVQVYLNTTEPGTSPLSAKLRLGVPANLGGMEYTYTGDSQYLVFQAKNDPGGALSLASLALFIVCMLAVFYLPHIRVWATIVRERDGGSHLLLRTDSIGAPGAEAALYSLVGELENRLSGWKVYSR